MYTEINLLSPSLSEPLVCGCLVQFSLCNPSFLCLAEVYRTKIGNKFQSSQRNKHQATSVAPTYTNCRSDIALVSSAVWCYLGVRNYDTEAFLSFVLSFSANMSLVSRNQLAQLTARNYDVALFLWLISTFCVYFFQV